MTEDGFAPGRRDERGGRDWDFVPAWLTPVQALLLLAVLAQALFTVGLQHPMQPYFDETHYVPAARALVSGTAYVNVEHPLFAKTLIGLGMWAFGDDPFGWRLIGAVMGTLTVLAVFLIAQGLFRDVRIGFVAGLLTILNQLVYVHARIAMLDVYMGAFLLLGLALLIDAWRGGGSQRGVHLRFAAAGLLFGLAVGSKWAALPYLLLVLLAFAGAKLIALRRGAKEAWPDMPAVAGLAWLGGLSLAAYLATFIPAFLVEENRLAVADLLSHQLEIYGRQTDPLSDHPYMSQWWQWPHIGRPIWYLYERVDGVMRGVLLVGNPAIMWGGLVAVVACLVGGTLRRDRPLLLAGALYLFAYGVWIVIPKPIGFYYYYYLPAIFLSIALAAAFDRFCRRGAASLIPPVFGLTALLMFIHFLPIISAAPLASEGAFDYWMWFDSWR